jgi:hypothetical protein
MEGGDSLFRNSNLEIRISKQILHDGLVTPAYRQAGANDENCDSLLSPPPLMGEGEGGGGHLVFVPLTSILSRQRLCRN